MKMILAAALAALMCACQHQPVRVTEVVKPPSNRVFGYQEACEGCVPFVVTRDPAMSASCPIRVSIDGAVLADLRPGEAADGYATPGQHLLDAQPRGRRCAAAPAETRIVLDREHTKTYRIGADDNGAMHITLTAF
ncbi:MAG TPA: hypothetical protein VM074_00985 [Solimonas sp.]|nr:hypothetical protein [Solimonas sp.]